MQNSAFRIQTPPRLAGFDHSARGPLLILAACALLAGAPLWSAAQGADSEVTALVTIPPLDALEPAVAEQIGAALRDVERVRAANRSGREIADAFGALAQVLHVYEAFDGAEAAYLQAQRAAGNDPRWRHLLGYLYQQTGRFDAAVEQFSAVRRLHPERREATARLADAYLQLGRLREARELFDEVLATFPAVARQGLGEIALRQGRFDEARGHFLAVLERVPTATAVHYSLAMAYRGLGRLDDARAHLRQRSSGTVRLGDPIVEALERLIRGERGLVALGRRAYEAGQFREAAAAFERAVQEAPSSAPARANLGLALLQLDDRAGARAQFEAALRVDAANVTAHSGFGLLLLREDRGDEALTHLRRAAELAPDEKSVRNTLLQALVRLGRDEEAIAVLKAAGGASDEETIVAVAILLAGRARYSEAVATLDRAYRESPDYLAAGTTLARLLAAAPDRSVRDAPRALDIATAVYASAPGPAHAETMAIALGALGRCAEAVTWLRRAIAEADAAKDQRESVRLRAELPAFERTPCAIVD